VNRERRENAPRRRRSSELAVLRSAAALVRGGGLLAVPTDTVYGVVCDPRDGAAVDRLEALKGRPSGMQLSILGDSVAQLEEHGTLGARARRLADSFWPGPLSMIVPVAAAPGRFAVPRSGSTVSLRIPDSDLLRALMRVTGPLASTSANLHGEPPARTWEECLPLLDRGLDAVLCGPPAAGGSSTIIDLTQAPPRVLRPGPLTLEVLRPFLGG
jgi:L-threonylcarbamoyladenylate synthase